MGKVCKGEDEVGGKLGKERNVAQFNGQRVAEDSPEGAKEEGEGGGGKRSEMAGSRGQQVMRQVEFDGACAASLPCLPVTCPYTPHIPRMPFIIPLHPVFFCIFPLASVPRFSRFFSTANQCLSSSLFHCRLRFHYFGMITFDEITFLYFEIFDLMLYRDNLDEFSLVKSNFWDFGICTNCETV